jgi:heavy metal sensor kinase
VFLRGAARQPAVRATIDVPTSGTSGFRTLQTPGGAYVRMLTVERTLGSRPYWIRVVRTEDDLREELRTLTILFSLLAPLAVLAAAGAGYTISGRALQPVARMAERARSISAERLSERLPVGNPVDELGQLALVFNETFARLEASFQRLKQFTADASHELRTPLTAIRSVGEVGLREIRDAPAYQEIIGSMLEEANRLAAVVDTLLTLSRWDSGTFTAARKETDLGALAEDVAGHLVVLAEDRDIDVQVAVERPLVVLIDPVMIRQAVMNVLDNAIKFTRDGGRVRMWSRSVDRLHEIVVDDEGPGIAAEDRARVLERFYRTESGRGHATRGAGLGLAIVHWAVTMNEGQISIEDNEWGGARVTLAFPRRSAPA